MRVMCERDWSACRLRKNIWLNDPELIFAYDQELRRIFNAVETSIRPPHQKREEWSYPVVIQPSYDGRLLSNNYFRPPDPNFQQIANFWNFVSRLTIQRLRQRRQPY